MADITDYVDGTAFIRLPIGVFNDKEYFRNICAFLKLPIDTEVIENKSEQRLC